MLRQRWAAIVVAVLLAGGCTSAARQGRSTANRPERAGISASDEPVVRAARVLLPSTVEIFADEARGSGFIYDRKGLILSAAHIVEGRKEVFVRLANGKRATGKVLGTDPPRDVAVIRIKRSGLRPARLAKGVKIEVGQLVIAIGNPFGLNATVTSGVVSATGRFFPTKGTGGGVEAIQTDAALNPGNSGGALADRYGRVIGINIAVRGESGSGVAFAVPIDVALTTAARLAEGKPPLPEAFLGIEGRDTTSGPAGALITTVRPGSAAARAGLRVGDVVYHFDDKPIKDMEDFAKAIRSHLPGDRVKLRVVRDNRRFAVKVTLGRGE